MIISLLSRYVVDTDVGVALLVVLLHSIMAQVQEKPSANTQTSVKVVDFGPFLDGSDRQGVADAVLESFKSIGFVYLANHGLPHEKVASMFELVRRFYSNTREDNLFTLFRITSSDIQSKKLFDQPMEIKQLAPHPESGAHHRGSFSPVLSLLLVCCHCHDGLG